jgi:hypothetical protein
MAGGEDDDDDDDDDQDDYVAAEISTRFLCLYKLVRQAAWVIKKYQI